MEIEIEPNRAPLEVILELESFYWFAVSFRNSLCSSKIYKSQSKIPPKLIIFPVYRLKKKLTKKKSPSKRKENKR